MIRDQSLYQPETDFERQQEQTKKSGQSTNDCLRSMQKPLFYLIISDYYILNDFQNE